jgi:hypothetical protein
MRVPEFAREEVALPAQAHHPEAVVAGSADRARDLRPEPSGRGSDRSSIGIAVRSVDAIAVATVANETLLAYRFIGLLA